MRNVLRQVYNSCVSLRRGRGRMRIATTVARLHGIPVAYGQQLSVHLTIDQ